ncbi:MAG: transposase [Actinobacteria bacterium]|nr:transposase [Actinomycetota bacterium]
MRKTLVDQRTEWLQRIHAVLFHHGVPVQPGRLARLDARDARAQLAELELPPVAQQQITVALGIIDHLNGELHTLDLELERVARRQPGCRGLIGHYGIGPLVATAILAELGDTRRLSSSRQAVRCAGLDVTVHESDTRRRAGNLSRQGSPVLAGRPSKPRNPRHDRPHLTTTTTFSSKRASAPTVPR